MTISRTDAVRVSDLVGGGYADFWKFKGRYRVVKGSRGSKKSKTTALWIIINMMKPKYKDANTLVIRKQFDKLRNSCFSDLLWAIRKTRCQDYWKASVSPLQLEYLPTGQKILFYGMDDSLKITSVSVEKGCLCWAWIEEAYQIESETDFNTVDESIRGEVPKGLFKQITLTLNPWSEHHWIKRRFFDADPDPDIMAKTTTYKCNEWLDESDLRLFERMKRDNPRRYQVAGLGEWGVVDGLVFENWEIREFDVNEIRKRKNIQAAFGLDFGYTIDPTAFVGLLVDEEMHEIYVFFEIYQKGMSNEEIYRTISEAGYAKEIITADAAEPKSIDRLRTLGIRRIRAAKKGPDSIRAGIDFLQDFRIIIHPRCSDTAGEISQYCWKEDPKTGRKINEPVDDFNHAIDAMRYATEHIARGPTFRLRRQKT